MVLIVTKAATLMSGSLYCIAFGILFIAFFVCPQADEEHKHAKETTFQYIFVPRFLAEMIDITDV